MRYISNTRTLAFHFESLVALKNSWHLLVLAAAFVFASATMSPAQVRELPDGTVELAVEPTEFNIETALEQLEEELGFTIEKSTQYMRNDGLLDPLVNSAEYTAVFLYTERNNQLRAEAARTALEAAMAEETLRGELQELQLKNGMVVDIDDHTELQGAYYALEEELTLLQGDYQILHATLEVSCTSETFRTENTEACGIVLGTAEDDTN